MEWTHEIEDILAEYGLEAEIMYYIYSDCIKIYHSRVNYVQMPSIVITTLVGALSFNDALKLIPGVNVTLASLNILVAVLQTSLKFLNYVELEQQSIALAIKYKEIYEDIRRELQHNPINRTNSSEFLLNITKRREEIYKNFTIISDIVKDKFKKRHKELNKLPIDMQHIKKIKIFGRSDMSSIESTTPLNSLKDESV